MPDAAEAWRAYEAAIRGDLAPIASSDDASSAAWRTLYDAVRSSLGAAPPPSPPRTRTDLGVLAKAASLCHRAAFVAFDPWRAREWAQIASDASSTSPASWELIRLRELIAKGHPDAVAHAQRVGTRAAERNDAEAVCESSALRALAHLHRDEIDDGLRIARRASRMSRAEGILELEYLANLVLARARRMSGQGHLASRILRALELICPPRWRGWIAWERAMAGEGLGQVDDGEVASRAARALGAWLTGASPTVPGLDFAPALSDLACVRAALGDGPITDAVAAWANGETARLPPALRGFDDGALVLRGPVEPGRRILRAGEHRVPAAARTSSAAVDQDAGRAHGVLAVLALARAPIAPEDLFQRVWGGRYVSSKHDGMFRVAIHRARRELGDRGAIERRDAGLTLTSSAPILVPDPRCEPSMEGRVLAALGACGGRADAKELSQALGVGLRHMQRTLSTLVDEGACVREVSGRRTLYVLDDTTFSEPSMTRLRAADGSATST
ncbi:MAG: hypothetical protein AB7S26_22465 [Sandaracinaceae bacterium]